MPPEPQRLHGTESQAGVEQTVARLTDRPDVGAPQSLLISLAELARLLGISRASAERMKAAGRLPPHVAFSPQLHRWRMEEVRQWIAAGCPGRREWLARTGRNRG